MDGKLKEEAADPRALAKTVAGMIPGFAQFLEGLARRIHEEDPDYVKRYEDLMRQQGKLPQQPVQESKNDQG